MRGNEQVVDVEFVIFLLTHPLLDGKRFLLRIQQVVDGLVIDLRERYLHPKVFPLLYFLEKPGDDAWKEPPVPKRVSTEH